MRISILVVLVALSWGRFCLQNGQITAQLAALPAPAGPLSPAGLRPRPRRFHRHLVYGKRYGAEAHPSQHAVQVAKLRLCRVLTLIHRTDSLLVQRYIRSAGVLLCWAAAAAGVCFLTGWLAGSTRL